MNDDEKRNPSTDGEKATEEAQETAEKAEDATAEAKKTAEEAREAVEEVKAEIKEETKKPAKEVSKKLEDIISDIEKLSVLELSDLVKALEERFGVTAATPTVVGSAAPTGTAGGETVEAPEEGQTSFNVIITDAGVNKISVIKAVREIVPTLGLKEAKDLVDSAPKPVVEGVGKEAANQAKAKLEAAGGKAELK